MARPQSSFFLSRQPPLAGLTRIAREGGGEREREREREREKKKKKEK